MAVPSMSTFYAGQRLRAADMNSQVRDAVNWTISGNDVALYVTGRGPSLKHRYRDPVQHGGF